MKVLELAKLLSSAYYHRQHNVKLTKLEEIALSIAKDVGRVKKRAVWRYLEKYAVKDMNFETYLMKTLDYKPYKQMKLQLLNEEVKRYAH